MKTLTLLAMFFGVIACGGDPEQEETTTATDETYTTAGDEDLDDEPEEPMYDDGL